MKIHYFVLALIMLTINGCGGSNDSDDSGNAAMLKSLNDNLAKWNNAGLNNYLINSKRICFCASVEEVIVNVEEGMVKDARYLSSGEYLTIEELQHVYSVNEYFEIIREAINQQANVLRVDYDNDLGFPGNIYIDYDAAIADDEITYEISNLQ